MILSLAAIVIVYGTPLLFGRSWFPLPSSVPGINPGPLIGYDGFSFPHVDWPGRLAAKRALLEGSLPLWDPNIALGVPLAAQYQSQLFLPIEWVEVFLGPIAWNVGFVLKVMVAWAGTFLFVNLLYKSRPASVVAATVYAFSAYFLWFPSVTAFISGAVILPWLFWAILRVLDKDTHPASAVGMCGALGGILWVTGQPQIAAVSSLFGTLFFLVCLALGPSRGRWRAVVVAAPVPVLALGLAALPLGVFTEAVRHGYTIHNAGTYAQNAPDPSVITLALWPFSFGQLMMPWEPSLFPQHVNPESFPFVAGASGLLLASVGSLAAVGRRNRSGGPIADAGLAPLVVTATILGVMLLQSLGVPVWTLPGINRVNLARYGAPLLSLLMAALVARGIVALPSRRLLWSALVVSGAISSLALWIFLRYVSDFGTGRDLSYFVRSMFSGFGPFLMVFGSCFFVLLRSHERTNYLILGLLACVLAEMTFLIRYGIPEFDGVRLIASAALCAAGVIACFGRRRLAFSTAALGLAVTVGIFVGAEKQMPRSVDPYASSYPWLDFTRQALGGRSQKGRVLTASMFLLPNSMSGFGVAQLNSAIPVQTGATAWYIFNMLSKRSIHYATPNAWPGISLRDETYPNWESYRERRRFYNLAAVRFILDSPSGEIVANLLPDMKLVYTDDHVAIVEDERALPRAFALDRAIALRNTKEVTEAMLDRGDPTSVAFVEAKAKDLPEPLLRTSPATLRPLRITTLRSDTVQIAVDAPRDEVIVLADAFHPGWRVEVDGEPAEVLRAYGAFRAVVVPRGAQTITFSYLPTRFWVYLAVTSFFACVIMTLLVCGRQTARTPRWWR